MTKYNEVGDMRASLRRNVGDGRSNNMAAPTLQSLLNLQILHLSTSDYRTLPMCDCGMESCETLVTMYMLMMDLDVEVDKTQLCSTMPPPFR